MDMKKTKMQLGILAVAIFVLLSGLNFSCDKPFQPSLQEQNNSVYQKSLNFATEKISNSGTSQSSSKNNYQNGNNTDNISTINNACRTQALYSTCQNTCNLYPTCNNTCSGTQYTCLGYPTCNSIPTVCTFTCMEGCGTK